METTGISQIVKVGTGQVSELYTNWTKVSLGKDKIRNTPTITLKFCKNSAVHLKLTVILYL
jgi:hypothetical protein